MAIKTPENSSWLTRSIEPELAGASIPRVARLTKKSQMTMRLFWNAWFVVIGLLGFFWRRDYETWTKLITHGVVTEATVYDKHTRVNKSRSYYLDYVFDTDFNPVRSSKSVPGIEYEDTLTGTTFPVTYLPGTQGEIWQEGIASPELRRQATTQFLWGGAIASVLLAGLIAWRSHSMRQQLWFLRQGVAITGYIFAGSEVGDKNGYTYYLEYRYTVANLRHFGKLRVREDIYNAAMREKDAYCTVLYDAMRPSRSMPYFTVQDAYLVAAVEE